MHGGLAFTLLRYEMLTSSEPLINISHDYFLHMALGHGASRTVKAAEIAFGCYLYLMKHGLRLLLVFTSVYVDKSINIRSIAERTFIIR
jgi:hypothetical protein